MSQHNIFSPVVLFAVVIPFQSSSRFTLQCVFVQFLLYGLDGNSTYIIPIVGLTVWFAYFNNIACSQKPMSSKSATP